MCTCLCVKTCCMISCIDLYTLVIRLLQVLPTVENYLSFYNVHFISKFQSMALLMNKVEDFILQLQAFDWELSLKANSSNCPNNCAHIASWQNDNIDRGKQIATEMGPTLINLLL